MPPMPLWNALPAALGVASLCAVLLACAGGDDAGRESAEGAVPAAPAAPASEAVATAAEGTGSVSYDGVQYDDFRGNCELSRNSGREDMGDVADTVGLRPSVAIDNVASTPAVEMNFVIISSALRFTMVRGAERVSGTVSQLGYDGPLTPKGTSQAVAPVVFTGQTTEGVPVVARIICEIQNRF